MPILVIDADQLEGDEERVDATGKDLAFVWRHAQRQHVGLVNLERVQQRPQLPIVKSDAPERVADGERVVAEENARPDHEVGGGVLWQRQLARHSPRFGVPNANSVHASRAKLFSPWVPVQRKNARFLTFKRFRVNQTGLGIVAGFDDLVQADDAVLAANGDHVQLGVVPHGPDGACACVECCAGLNVKCSLLDEVKLAYRARVNVVLGDLAVNARRQQVVVLGPLQRINRPLFRIAGYIAELIPAPLLFLVYVRTTQMRPKMYLIVSPQLNRPICPCDCQTAFRL